MVMYANGPGTKSVGIVLQASPRQIIDPSDLNPAQREACWLEVLWDDGLVEGIYASEVSFVKKENSS